MIVSGERNEIFQQRHAYTGIDWRGLFSFLRFVECGVNNHTIRPFLVFGSESVVFGKNKNNIEFVKVLSILRLSIYEKDIDLDEICRRFR